MFKDQHLLIICTVWPEPASSAAGSRMLELIRVFLEQGCQITLASDANSTEYSFDFTGLNVNLLSIELNNPSFDEQLKQIQPTMVLFDRFMTEEKYGWRITEQCPGALKLLDTEDLHCLRKARQDAFKAGKTFVEDDLISDTAKREIASIYRCDLSLIISPFEMDLLQDYFRIDKQLLHYLPFLSDPVTEKQIAQWPAFSNREHFVTIGNFFHEPNVNSVFYLKEDIWPLIRKKMPSAQMHIYGAYAPDKIINLQNAKQGFLIKGRAPDSKTVISNARVLLAPLRFGAGIKGKLSEAMQYGTPSVTTSIGAEGMTGDNAWNGFVANSPDEIADAAVTLYADEKLWKQSQLNGVNIINTVFSKEKHIPLFLDRLLQIQNTIAAHRTHNFIGAMLLHHSMAGTKYMARWIELKNKP